MPPDCPVNTDVTPYDRLLMRLQEKRHPFSVQWELTHRCNLRCRHCYLIVRPPDAPANDELPTEVCLGLLDQMAHMGILHLTLSGGEIFLREDLFTIAGYARERRFSLRLLSNGTLLDENTADRIAVLHPYAVEISLYGSDAVTHERVTRVPGSFAKTLGAFRHLERRGVRTVMKTMLMADNMHHLGPLRSLAQSVGAIFRADPVITARTDGSRVPLRFRVKDHQLFEYMRQASDPSAWPVKMPSPNESTCALGRGGFLIGPAGEVHPCAEIRTAMGNAGVQSLEEIWQDAAWQGLLLTRKDLPVCGRCSLQPFCSRCQGVALNEHGDMKAPAAVACRGAFMRMTALQEKGAVPQGYPVPEHLEALCRKDGERLIS